MTGSQSLLLLQEKDGDAEKELFQNVSLLKIYAS